MVYGVDLSVIARVNTPGLAQTVEAWNFALSQWDVLGQQDASTVESTQTLSVPGNVLNYVETGTHRVKMKVSWFRTGLTFVFPWTVSVDQVQWAINSA